MNTAQSILEDKEYDIPECYEIIHSMYGSLDMQTREEYEMEDQPIHLFESYYLGDADEDRVNEIASLKGYDCYENMLRSMDVHLIYLADSYPDKKSFKDALYYLSSFNSKIKNNETI